MKVLLITVLVIAPLAVSIAQETPKDGTFAPIVPEGYYAGPTGKWPSLKLLEHNSRELAEGSHIYSDKLNEQEYLKLRFEEKLFYMIILDGGSRLMDAWSEDYEAARPMKLFLNDGFVRALPQSSWDFFMQTQNRRGTWSFSITVIPDHKNAAYPNLPPNSIVYYWEGIRSGSQYPTTQ